MVVVGSAKGSPGVTTLACALGAVWPVQRRVLVAECDPAGGDIAVRFGLPARPGMTGFVFAARGTGAARGVEGARVSDDAGSTMACGTGGTTSGSSRIAQLAGMDTEDSSTARSVLDDHLQSLPGGLEVLVAPAGAEAAMVLDAQLANVVPSLASSGADVIADCGRLAVTSPGQLAMLRHAACLVLVARSGVADLSHLRAAASSLGIGNSCRGSETERCHRTVVVLVGNGDVEPRDVASETGLDEVMLMPTDGAAAASLGGHPGRTRDLERSPLIAAARQLAATIMEFPRSDTASTGGGPIETGGGGALSGRRDEYALAARLLRRAADGVLQRVGSSRRVAAW